jgi:hypothetical protein
MPIINFIIKHVDRIGDILAMPFFLLAAIYFYNIEKRDITENILLIFSFGGFLADVYFTYLFYKQIK